MSVLRVLDNDCTRVTTYSLYVDRDMELPDRVVIEEDHGQFGRQGNEFTLICRGTDVTVYGNGPFFRLHLMPRPH